MPVAASWMDGASAEGSTARWHRSTLAFISRVAMLVPRHLLPRRRDGDLVQVLQGEDHGPDEDDDLDLTVDTARVPAISPRLVAPPNFE